jgi:peroxiredoxin
MKARPRRDALRALCALGLLAARASRAAPALPGERVAWPEVALLGGGHFGPADAAGRACVVVFWSTTCPFCRRHNRHVQKLHELRTPGLVVLGVARETDAELVRGHAAAQGYGFPITLATEPLAAALSRRRLIPLTVTIDRDGRLRQVIPGEMSEDDVLELARLAG